MRQITPPSGAGRFEQRLLARAGGSAAYRDDTGRDRQAFPDGHWPLEDQVVRGMDATNDLVGRHRGRHAPMPDEQLPLRSDWEHRVDIQLPGGVVQLGSRVGDAGRVGHCPASVADRFDTTELLADE